MDNLISGLMGAIIATVITVCYMYFSEMLRRRHDVTLEVVAYSDEFYSHIQIVHFYKLQELGENKEISEPDAYSAASRALRILVLSSGVHARTALVYGEHSSELKMLQALRSYIIESARTLWRANKGNWEETNTNLLANFEKIIDPLRLSTELNFIRSVKMRSILKDWFMGFWCSGDTSKSKTTNN